MEWIFSIENIVIQTSSMNDIHNHSYIQEYSFKMSRMKATLTS